MRSAPEPLSFPGVEIGSYPRWMADADGRLRSEVRVTFEAENLELARRARAALAARLDPDTLLPDEPS